MSLCSCGHADGISGCTVGFQGALWTLRGDALADEDERSGNWGVRRDAVGGLVNLRREEIEDRYPNVRIKIPHAAVHFDPPWRED